MRGTRGLRALKPRFCVRVRWDNAQSHYLPWAWCRGAFPPQDRCGSSGHWSAAHQKRLNNHFLLLVKPNSFPGICDAVRLSRFWEPSCLALSVELKTIKKCKSVLIFYIWKLGLGSQRHSNQDAQNWTVVKRVIFNLEKISDWTLSLRGSLRTRKRRYLISGQKQPFFNLQVPL